MGFLGGIKKYFGPRPKAPEPSDLAIRFKDFSEYPSDEVIPYLDRKDIDETKLTPAQAAWRRTGVLILRDFIPDDVTAPYIERRAAYGRPAGWQTPTPYVHVPEMRSLALYPPLMAQMKELVGEDMMLHLCLTGWVSTQRGWHQDDYLNPPHVNCWYAAVWIALGDIGPDCGPFEYVPGSHRWPLMRGDKVKQFLTHEELTRISPGLGYNDWEVAAERFVNPAINAEIKACGQAPVPFFAKRGDVLIWHGRLIHQGSLPKVKGMERRSLIAHYSGVNHRDDMPERRTDENGSVYAHFDAPLRD